MADVLSPAAPSDATPQAILAADVGSTRTHVCLIQRVEGSHRLVARAESPTTAGEPENDITIGVCRAIQEMEAIVQRPLLDSDGDVLTPMEQSGRAGVDAFVATASAAPPLRCVIIGLTDDLSVETAARTCAAANTVVHGTISLGETMRRWDDATLQSLHEAPPDVILMVGGVDTGPVAPLESAALVLATIYETVDAAERPVIVFAGNQEARRTLRELLAPLFDYRVVDNVRPDVHTEMPGELHRELTAIYQHIALPRVPGYSRLQEWAATPILSTSEALGHTWRFIAQRDRLERGLLGIDVGGVTTHVGAVRQVIYQWAVSASLGTSQGAEGLLRTVGRERLLRWLPIPLSAAEALSYLQNAHLRPYSIPQTMEDLVLGHAMLREAIGVSLGQMRHLYWAPEDGESAARSRDRGHPVPSFDLIAARGGFIAHTPQDGLITMALLDAVQPIGLVRVVTDWATAWPQLGAVAAFAPLAAAQVLACDGFHTLGTVIAPSGTGKPGEIALRLRIERDDGQTIALDVPAGTVRRVPLAVGQRARVQVYPSRAFDIGLGRRGVGGQAEVMGGSMGIVIDARGRPLELSEDMEECRTRNQLWLRNLIDDDADAPA
ncbi:MAG TPA: hypothetical protein GX714_14255 [Chloroflexi bacterium]|jgi:hypothetical protein|nr:hypothetical protein [Chloroflexota bacterium]